MSPRTQRAFQALILAALGVFFLHKIWSGTLYWYINNRFLVLVLSAGVGFLALSQIVLQGLRRQKPEAEPHDDGRPQRHDHSPPHAPNPSHSHPALSTWGLIIVALPVLLGVLIPARPLGSSAIANKGINTSAPLTAAESGQAVRLDLAATDRTILDWVRAFNYEADPTVFDGQPADVVGFVYHDTRLAEGQFLVGRFAVSCCVADALALGMIVNSAQAASLPDNSWVRVHGPVQAAHLDGRPIPLIMAESIEQVAEPEQPYLYP
jgi:uncharacterized repeat protein (TIGR03943 family)